MSIDNLNNPQENEPLVNAVPTESNEKKDDNSLVKNEPTEAACPATIVTKSVLPSIVANYEDTDTDTDDPTCGVNETSSSIPTTADNLTV
jgi:hypothetical protein